MASSWSYIVAIAIFVLIYLLVLLNWSFKEEIWVLSPLFTLPFTNVVLPGALGLGGIFIPKENKILNTVGFGFCMSALIAPVFFLAFEGLTKADTFLSIQITY